MYHRIHSAVREAYQSTIGQSIPDLRRSGLQTTNELPKCLRYGMVSGHRSDRYKSPLAELPLCGDVPEECCQDDPPHPGDVGHSG